MCNKPCRYYRCEAKYPEFCIGDDMLHDECRNRLAMERKTVEGLLNRLVGKLVGN